MPSNPTHDSRPLTSNAVKAALLVSIVLGLTAGTAKSTAMASTREIGDSKAIALPSSANARDAHIQILTQKLALAKAQGATDHQISSKWHLRRIPTKTVQGLNSQATSGSNMNVQAPELWYDDTAHNYAITANWGWYKKAWKKDVPIAWLVRKPKNVGGEDAFAIAFQEEISNKGGAMAICGARIKKYYDLPKCWQTNNVMTNNPNGEAIAFQDKGAWNTAKSYVTNADRGSYVFAFDWKKNVACNYIWSAYGHDWSKTTLSSIGIDGLNIVINFSNGTRHWNKVSPVVQTSGCP